MSQRRNCENAATVPGGLRESLWTPKKIRFQFRFKCSQWHVFAQGWWQTVPHCPASDILSNGRWLAVNTCKHLVWCSQLHTFLVTLLDNHL